MRMVSGKRYYYGKDDILTEIVAEVFSAMSVSHVGDYLPVLRWLGVSKLEKELMVLQAKRDLFMQELVEEIRCGMENNSCEEKLQKRNMIQVFLSLQQTEPECYTDETIRSIILIMKETDGKPSRVFSSLQPKAVVFSRRHQRATTPDSASPHQRPKSEEEVVYRFSRRDLQFITKLATIS